MRTNHDCAVIFDVDGPLLELTVPEEDAFFAPFQEIYGLEGLSRDWDSYRVRNDADICREILSGHLRREPEESELADLASRYFATLEESYRTGAARVVEIAGARALLQRIAACSGIALGIATANFHRAAQIRLERAGMWHLVEDHAGAADGGGAKSEVLARVLGKLDLPGEKVVFLGDNLNDLEAGHANGVHFIGFHVEAERRQRLTDAGAAITAGDHDTSWALICELLGL